MEDLDVIAFSADPSSFFVVRNPQIPLSPPKETPSIAIREASTSSVPQSVQQPSRKKQKRELQEFEEFDAVRDPDRTRFEGLKCGIMDYVRGLGTKFSLNHLKVRQEEYKKTFNKPLRPSDIDRACKELVEKGELVVHFNGRSKSWTLKSH